MLPASACTAQTAGAAGPDRITRTLYDDADRVVKVETAYGVSGQQADEVTTTWSDNGKPLTLTDAEGNRTTYEYDGHDRLAKTRYPSPTTDGVSSATDYEAPTYDAGGNVTSVRLRDGQSIALTYDKLDRVTAKNLPGSEPDVSYEYDLLGRVTEASQPGHALTFDHDALGRMTSATGPLGTTSYQYDLAGRRTRLTWPDAFHVTYDWNAANQLTHIRENGAASGAGVLATYGYDDLGRRVSVTRGNGTSTSYGYDAVSRLSSLGQDLAGTTHDLTLGLTYNPAGQIATNTRSNDLYAWGGHHNKDVAETPNGLNQATAQGTVSIGHDARGNMTSKGSASYSYTSENLLKTGPGGVTLHYDGLGRLAEYDTSVSTRFVYDGGRLIAEVANPSGAVQKRYVHGPGADEPIVEYAGSGTSAKTWLHADERGSIIARSNISGAMTAINAYDEHGIPAATNTGRHQYTGQTWLPELQMYYKARIYDPKLGRFVQADPIGYGDGMNMYAYVGGDPINATDPWGLLKVTCADGTKAASIEECEGGLAPTSGGPTPGEIPGRVSNNPNDCRPPGCYVNGSDGSNRWVSVEYRSGMSGVYLNGFWFNQLNTDALAQAAGGEVTNSTFSCVGGNILVSGGVCYDGNEGYLYSGAAFPPGLDFTLGYAPGGAPGYLNGWSIDGNGLPGAGIGFTNGAPTSHAWTFGTPGLSASYGTSFTAIKQGFYSTFEEMSDGFYHRLGSPYDVPNR